MKRSVWIFAGAAVVLAAVIAVLVWGGKPELEDILESGKYRIQEQTAYPCTLRVPVSALGDGAYSSEGQTYEPDAVTAFETETSRIYLKKAMMSNESSGLMYISFDFDHELPDDGSVLLPYTWDGEERNYEDALKLKDRGLRTEAQTYADAVSVRGYGPEEEFMFYVSAEACRSAEGTMEFDIFCNQLTYEKD